MISYLDIRPSRQSIVDYNIPNLLHLIGFALPGTLLEVQDLGHSIAKKNVMASFHSFLKAKALQQLHQARKWDVCVAIPSQNSIQQFVDTRHRSEVQKRSL